MPETNVITVNQLYLNKNTPTKQPSNPGLEQRQKKKKKILE